MTGIIVMNSSSGKGIIYNGIGWYDIESLGFNKFRIIDPFQAPENQVVKSEIGSVKIIGWDNKSTWITGLLDDDYNHDQ